MKHHETHFHKELLVKPENVTQQKPVLSFGALASTGLLKCLVESLQSNHETKHEILTANNTSLHNI